MSKKQSIIISLISIVFLVAIDQISKFLAVTYLQETSGISLIPNVFSLYYLENYGAAFGSLKNATVFFVILTVVSLVAIIYIWMHIPEKKVYLPLRIVVLFFTAGALGNFIDRICHAYVVDFLYFSLINFPVFNVADIYVTCSSIAFLILYIFYYKEDDFAFLKRGKNGRV